MAAKRLYFLIQSERATARSSVLDFDGCMEKNSVIRLNRERDGNQSCSFLSPNRR